MSDARCCDICGNFFKTYRTSDSALELIKELKWWREQDLVRREDVIHIIKAQYFMYQDYHIKEVLTGEVERLSKAEPKYSGCGHDMFCEKTDCKGCEAEPKENNQ